MPTQWSPHPKGNGKKRTLPIGKTKILTLLYTKDEDLQQKLTQKQWEQLFLSLYKNAKQKEVFEIQ